MAQFRAQKKTRDWTWFFRAKNVWGLASLVLVATIAWNSLPGVGTSLSALRISDEGGATIVIQNPAEKSYGPQKITEGDQILIQGEADTFAILQDADTRIRANAGTQLQVGTDDVLEIREGSMKVFSESETAVRTHVGTVTNQDPAIYSVVLAGNGIVSFVVETGMIQVRGDDETALTLDRGQSIALSSGAELALSADLTMTLARSQKAAIERKADITLGESLGALHAYWSYQAPLGDQTLARARETFLSIKDIALESIPNGIVTDTTDRIGSVTDLIGRLQDEELQQTVTQIETLLHAVQDHASNTAKSELYDPTGVIHADRYTLVSLVFGVGSTRSNLRKRIAQDFASDMLSGSPSDGEITLQHHLDKIPTGETFFQDFVREATKYIPQRYDPVLDSYWSR